MKKVLLIGAGRSATVLIDYLLSKSTQVPFFLTIAELNVKLAEEKLNNHPNGKAVTFDMHDEPLRKQLIQEHDIVISMLPAALHFEVAKDCVTLGKNMVTASYISDNMKTLHEEAVSKGILLLNEIGVDPGIDHMSALRIIDRLQSKGAYIRDFESFTGGLPAPESDDNPWHYKFFWAPRNVVLASQGGACKFLHEGTYKYIPYQRVFRRTEIVRIEPYGKFEGYANRDSLKYQEAYKLQDAKTVYRGTFRKPGYCKAWDCLVQLGATDDSYIMANSHELTNREFINSFLYWHPTDSVETKLAQQLRLDLDSLEMEKLTWLGLFDDTVKPGLKNATPAQMLLHILEQKWTPKPEDKDMVVMWHKFVYELNGEHKTIHSSMVCIGESANRTAMAKTVGLPLGIAAVGILTGKITGKGVLLPVYPEIYNPVLDELEEFGIQFQETEF